ncbi:RagB/SusD family nutrient uptake outer membrane protein [Chitinophaga sp. 30R24]|uniref:RagB/SusD family nutrient uptake outer membrane protein n=1 Tax=Chitinophaga sp. 30R24 TaxID=3248838 RepID=UPI003B9023C5
MKTIYNKLLIAVMMIILSSCGKNWLDLLPSNKIESSVAIKTVTDARSAINGVYYQMQRSSYYGGRMMWHADICGDDIRTWGNSSTRSGATYRYDYNPQNAPSELWSQPYAVIRLANNLLSLIDHIEVTPAQTTERNYIKGEALMARALAHFDICRVYGYPYLKNNGASLGACIVTSPLAADAKPVRSTVAECYEQVIIPDLVAAIPLLSTDRTASRARFNRWAAKLLLSRVYLYKGDNVNALREAEECITGAQAAGYALYTNTNYPTQWQTKYSTESLFEIVNNAAQNTGSDGIPNWCAANTSNAYHEIGLTQSFYNLLSADPNDVRLTMLRKGVNYASAFPAFILKYTNGGSAPTESNVTLYRLSEAYLNAAEAAAKLGDQNDKAVSYLNAIVKRENPAKSITDVVTLEKVLEERRKELFGEGHRAFDLLRNGLTIFRADDAESKMFLPDYAKVIDWNNFRCILPIPIVEIDANSNIVPNPWGN